MSHLYNFEKLEVWQLSRQFAVNIYKITELFPSSEKYGLSSQIRRATISVVSNIAEGANRSSPKDQANFYQMAYSSLTEVLSQLIVSLDLNFIAQEEYDKLREKIEQISNKLNALRNRILSR